MNNKGADQIVRVRRLICTFVVPIWQKQVFSWRGKHHERVDSSAKYHVLVHAPPMNTDYSFIYTLNIDYSLNILYDDNCHLWDKKQVAQRATIAHLSPMCPGQISFQKTYKWAMETRGPKLNSSELLCLSWLSATLMMIRSKMNEPAWRHHFPIISLWEIF